MKFEPKFTLTPKLLSTINQIERLYGQLEGLRLPKKLELNLHERNLVQSAYVSNSIEGNPLSLMEVTNLLLGDRVPVNRDEKEVYNYHEILSSLDVCLDKPVDLKLINDFHSKLLYGVQDEIAGEIRNDKVVIGKYTKEKTEASIQVKHEPPFHTKDEIEQALVSLNEWLVAALKNQPATLVAGIYHHEFVYIHPYADGNGRTCRLIAALIFLKAGYKINRHFVLDDYYDIDRIQYSDMLHTADSGDKTEWLEYFTDGVNYSLQSALEKAKRSLQTLNIEERLTGRESEVLGIVQERGEITSHIVAEILDVTRQQAHSLLSALVEKGFVDKKGSTKSSYYVLK
ncbi:Fic family protein [Patescibacteria group bacterium]